MRNNFNKKSLMLIIAVGKIVFFGVYPFMTLRDTFFFVVKPGPTRKVSGK